MDTKRVIIMQGHMSKKAASMPGLWGMQFSLDEWKRRYFVLHANGDLWYYKSYKAFQNSPEKRLKERAVELGMYDVRTLAPKARDADDDHNDDHDDGDSGSDSGNSTVAPGTITGSPMHGGLREKEKKVGAHSLDIFLVPNEAVFRVITGSGSDINLQPRVWHFQLDKDKEHQEWVAAMTSMSATSILN
jgi:hypothetical protein